MKTCDCGQKMVLKKNRFNKNIFWGCPQYPKCSHTETISDHNQDKASRRYDREQRKRLQAEVDEEEAIKSELRGQGNDPKLVAAYTTNLLLFNFLVALKFSMRKIEKDDGTDD